MEPLLLTTLLAPSVLAASFAGFSSAACQKGDGTYVPLSAAQIQSYVVANCGGLGSMREVLIWLRSSDMSSSDVHAYNPAIFKLVNKSSPRHNV